MTDSSAIRIGARSAAAASIGTFCIFLVISAYVVLLFAHAPEWCGPALCRFLDRTKSRAGEWIMVIASCLGFGRINPLARTGAYLLLWALVVPWLVMIILGRGRTRDLGIRVPNRLGWRLPAVGFVLALPFLVWMSASPGIAAYYIPHLERDFTSYSAFYLVNMLSEHFLFQGVMLAAFRPGGRWPDDPPIAGDATHGWRRAIQWLGLAQPAGEARGLQRVTRWCGLPDHCLAAILGSGTLFAAVHVSKDPRELALSLPGGIAIGYVAYRTNSCLVPFGLHVGTAGAAVLMMLMFGGK